ncbi:ATP-dependent DNA helicase Q-like SIM isoform X1 [Phoenix dactylifera]|uniref:ATP-dependent DNA helicase n=1 Tax=Phoenix dactylifera TaxID=42345 RepID=A0A8B7CTJ9_PHODC|nr:ATP-dependent DNA helicase Q-like SIM isoform X1 [Phoenix dactylifera]XP_008805757.2 ATP-dependent DNA helicase Q-like SIM isoform X1 [Phoenix dactylifera]
MGENDVFADHIIAELIDMGFEFAKAIEAIEAVGPCLDDAVEFILNGSSDSKMAKNGQVSSNFTSFTSQKRSLGKVVMSSHPSNRMEQSSISHHISSFGRTKRSISHSASGTSFSGMKKLRSSNLNHPKVPDVCMNSNMELASQSFQQDVQTHVPPIELTELPQENGSFRSEQISHLCNFESEEAELDWEDKVSSVLQKHFGFSSLKGFQKEALEAWLAHRDCLVLAATGSGKSLCFQIPALLTSKIVIVISPLISLMHDQCLNLAKHRISACFLGSGQPDRSVQCKAMNGVYRIVYVCPETILRLMEPLKRLAENPGIALFAIDEVHCVSKWGHDFRPDYGKLSVLRENFNTCNLKFLKFDIPLMALTATATIPVRKDIFKLLHMSKETRIVLTSFFRPNLRFSVKHSRTTASSYEKDFHELIKTYTMARMSGKKGLKHLLNDLEDDSNSSCKASDDGMSDENGKLVNGIKSLEDDHFYEDSDDASSANEDSIVPPLRQNQLTAEYLEDDLDLPDSVNEFDVSCGEFLGTYPAESSEFCGASEVSDLQGFVEQGPTIIYMPTRKETQELAKYLCRSGVRAAAYHAKMPKSHLRRVHEDFHQNLLEVVVATIAFGMGIDKSNVRRIIHYGWPQSLDAYYQEVGRAGRDGKPSDCTLYANLSRIPSLLPSQRSEEQTKQAYKMLSNCFRYGMNTATCRAKVLVKYFGEEFSYDKCNLCDICVTGAPEMQNLKEEADIFLRVLRAECGSSSIGTVSHDGAIYSGSGSRRFIEKPNFKMVISKIREQFHKFAASDRLWWQGLARILENMGYVREGDISPHVSIRYPELTDLGLRFLHLESEKTLYAYPEADMLLSVQKHKPHSSFSEWGRGWADPEIRRQRLQAKKFRTRKRKRQSRKHNQDLNTVRGRLAAKLSKYKH